MTLKYDYRYQPDDPESYWALMDSLEPTGFTSPVMQDKPIKNEAKKGNDNVDNQQLTGTVKFFNDARGFGFIDGDDGESYFVHYTGIMKHADEYRTLDDGQSVTFNREDTSKGPQAINVQK